MSYINDNFLLTNKYSKDLYVKYAKTEPIYDYHCHLSAKEIYENKRYKNITELWLGSDHYKWRAMRINGINEEYITGTENDYEKFYKWSETVSKLIGNPLYHWTHLELKMFFDIDTILSPKTSKEIYEKCNAIINKDYFNVRYLINKSNVQMIGTTDDPLDDLKYHILLNKDKSIDFKVRPSFRPDKFIQIEKDDFNDYLKKTNKDLKTVDDIIQYLNERVLFFIENGAKASDHGLEYMPFEIGSVDEINQILYKKHNNSSLSLQEINKFKTFILLELGKIYHKHNLVMQLHIGPMRNNNSRAFNKLGNDSGFDSINDFPIANQLSKFLNELDKSNQLPKTILYTLNPKDNYILSTMLGNFSYNSIPGKIQFGAAWWFNDSKTGMIEQMITLANTGLLSRFVGMLTDSRSFLSYARIDYFRRILCDLIGSWIDNNEIPYDEEIIGSMIKDICYNNAFNYFEKW